MAQKPGTPKGTRDFSPIEMTGRNFIFSTIRKVFEKYGYQPVETPAMENLDTLLGKYGEEGDKLLFRILNSGNFLDGIGPKDLEEQNLNKIASAITEKGLRYDLTVPFARYVVEHRHEITFPFKRYQIQPVWRADKPQKGRYREFYQCDVDVIGSDSLLNEVELVQIIRDVFVALGLKIELRLNNRKVLSGMAEHVGHPEKFMDITIAVDKLEKIGLDKVNEELSGRGLPAEAIEKLQRFLDTEGTTEERIDKIGRLLESSSQGSEGVKEMKFLFDKLNLLGMDDICTFDLTLARGLNYYTGTIFEVVSTEMQIGSICGGGRYDDLTGIFGLEGVSGVGISFGADRIYDVLTGTEKYPETLLHTTEVLFVNFGEEEARYILPVADTLRENNISCEIYPDAAKLKKQMKYADQKGIRFVVLAGEEEIRSGKLTVKDMESGEQGEYLTEDLIRLAAGK